MHNMSGASLSKSAEAYKVVDALIQSKTVYLAKTNSEVKLQHGCTMI